MLPTLPFPPLLLFFSSCITRRFTLRMLLTPYKCTFTQIHIFTRNFPKRRESWPTSCYGKHFQTRINQYKTFKTFSRRFNSARNPAKKKCSRPQNQYVTRSPAFRSELILEARASPTPVHGLPQRRVNPLSLALNHRQPSSRAKPRAHARPCRTSSVSSVCHILARETKQALELGPSVSS